MTNISGIVQQPICGVIAFGVPIQVWAVSCFLVSCPLTSETSSLYQRPSPFVPPLHLPDHLGKLLRRANPHVWVDNDRTRIHIHAMSLSRIYLSAWSTSPNIGAHLVLVRHITYKINQGGMVYGTYMEKKRLKNSNVDKYFQTLRVLCRIQSYGKLPLKTKIWPRRPHNNRFF